MSGIVGWIDFEQDVSRQRSVLEAMTGALACRGPDESGYWYAKHAAIGHRRLIVIDSEGGRQPMVRHQASHTYVLTYDGQLYNTEEVRLDLKRVGHSFFGYSDTEVLLAAYMQWGVNCLEKLNGVFAFAIWDETKQQLFLARDRLGIKPLFYARRGSSFLFASELKALLAHPAVQPEVDAEGLAEIFAIGPARTPGHGVFKDIHELLPGHYLIVNRQRIRSDAYWKLTSQPHENSWEETVEHVRYLLVDAVVRQLVSDRPVSTWLSGGLDSSAITALAAEAMAKKGAGPLPTYDVDYVGNEHYFQPNDFQPESDTPYIHLVAQHFGTRHRTIRLSNDELATALEAAVVARDLPGMADIDSSLLLFCREVKKESIVSLSGEGADEVFGGYPWFFRPDALSATVFPWSLKTEAREQVLSPELVRHIRPVEYIRDRYQQALAQVPRLAGESSEDARRREIAYLTLTRWMPVLIDRMDRMSMAVGLEVRAPFCDHRLVEYVWNVPWAMKSAGGQAKGLLRAALQGVLPDAVLNRKKSPYPKTFHPGYLAAMRQRVRELLADGTSPLRPLLNMAAVQQFIDADGEFDIPWFGQLMRLPQFLAYLVQVDTWMRRYRVILR